MVDVAALYHEVVQTPVCFQHQVVQDDESKQTSDGWDDTSHEMTHFSSSSLKLFWSAVVQ